MAAFSSLSTNIVSGRTSASHFHSPALRQWKECVWLHRLAPSIIVNSQRAASFECIFCRKGLRSSLLLLATKLASGLKNVKNLAPDDEDNYEPDWVDIDKQGDLSEDEDGSTVKRSV